MGQQKEQKPIPETDENNGEVNGDPKHRDIRGDGPKMQSQVA